MPALEERAGVVRRKGLVYRVHIKAKPVRENAVHLNFKKRLATNEEREKKKE